jgi:hypothetical protein
LRWHPPLGQSSLMLEMTFLASLLSLYSKGKYEHAGHSSLLKWVSRAQSWQYVWPQHCASTANLASSEQIGQINSGISIIIILGHEWTYLTNI